MSPPESCARVDTRRQVFPMFEAGRGAEPPGAARGRHGRGFGAGRPSHGHGLRNMAGRARLRGAAMEVNSRPGQGTALLLRIPPGLRRGTKGERRGKAARDQAASDCRG
jgi:hypothetical protein